VDAHRIPALVISPFAKRDAVVSTRYDQLSFIRTLEILVGLKPLHLPEALAVPLYDAFGSTPSNDEAYDVIKPNVDLTERNPNTAANRAASAGLNLDRIDHVPQRTLDRMLWRSVHGPRSKPPPPGPNASGIDDPDG
jgi:phospholipase C